MLFSSKEILNLLTIFKLPRNIEEISSNETVIEKIRELNGAGILIDAGRSPEEVWQLKTFPDNCRKYPKSISINLVDADEDEIRSFVNSSTAFFNQLAVQNGEGFNVVFFDIKKEKDWLNIFHFLNESCEKWDFFDLLNIHIVCKPIDLTESTLEMFKWYSIGIKVILDDIYSGETLIWLEKLLGTGKNILPEYSITKESYAPDNIISLLTDYKINKVSLQLDASVIEEPVPDIMDFLKQVEADYMKSGIQPLGFWNMASVLFENYKEPNPCYLPLSVNLKEKKYTVHRTEIHMNSMNLNKIDDMRTHMDYNLSQCAGCNIIGLCLGQIVKKYKNDSEKYCAVCRKRYEKFLINQLDILTEGTSV
jgi:hypothetical protein